MKRTESHLATKDEFFAQCRESFEFLRDHGFVEAALPSGSLVNPVQVRFFNGKLFFGVAGINWGVNIDPYFEDQAGERAGLFLFVPADQRKSQLERKQSEPEQCFQIRTAADQLLRYCGDILEGNTSRFSDRAAYWKKVMHQNLELSRQSRKLP